MIATKFPYLIKGFAAFVAVSASVTAEAAETAEKTSPRKEEAIELSPLVVDTTNDKGYSSKNTVGGTGFNITLMKLPRRATLLHP